MNRIKFSAAIFCIVISLNTQAQNIFRTACEGNLTRLDSLLNDSTDINKINRRGQSLLHFAIQCNQDKVIEFLLDQGIDINIKNKRGETPLLFALRVNNIEYFDLLKEKNATADFNLVRKDGSTPLERAVLEGHLEVSKRLVENGTNFNTVNKRGNSPLAIAQREGLDDISQYLISIGAESVSAPMAQPKGEYMGQIKPGLTPKMFAPNFISTEYRTQNAIFHPNGKEFYFTIESGRFHGGTIMVSKMNGEVWSKPQPMGIPGNYREVDPFITKDGLKLYYSTNRPIEESDSIGRRPVDLWVMNREGNGWSAPIHLGDEINTDTYDWFATVSERGNLYYSAHGIYCSEFKNGSYQKGKPLSDSINSDHYDYDPFIALDESYLIFASNRPGGFGGSDLYISFKNDDGSWSKAKNMGAGINSKSWDFAPGLSPDKNYFFFSSGRAGEVDLYWVDSQIIEDLKKDLHTAINKPN